MKSDQILIEEIKSGHKGGFAQLVKRHYKTMMRVAIRLTRDLEAAEDVVQESFIKAYQQLHRFEGKSSFRTWMYRITLNTARNRLRSKHRESVSVENLTLAVEGVAESKLMEDTLKGELQQEIERLPDRQREALCLRIFDDLSFKEIAEIMGCPYDTAKANYRHALLKLKDRVGNCPQFKTWKGENFSNDMETYVAEVKS